MTTIIEEIPSYSTLLKRKSLKVKTIETVAFMILLGILYVIFGNNTIFKVGAFVSAIITLGLSPLIYKITVKPKYVLTKTNIIIRKLNNQIEIPIVKIDQTEDLKYFYLINDKKTALSVSDEFIEKLDKQIELMKRKK